MTRQDRWSLAFGNSSLERCFLRTFQHGVRRLDELFAMLLIVAGSLGLMGAAMTSIKMYNYMADSEAFGAADNVCLSPAFAVAVLLLYGLLLVLGILLSTHLPLTARHRTKAKVLARYSLTASYWLMLGSMPLPALGNGVTSLVFSNGNVLLLMSALLLPLPFQHHIIVQLQQLTVVVIANSYR